jgi:DNA polymerase elongation subunit (family B)
MEMINIFSTANNSKEFMEKIPEALNVVKAYRQKMLNGEVPIEDLIISKHLSKNPNHYKQHISQVIAAEQLIKEGAEVNAGKNVHFVFTDSTHKRFERRVKAEQLLDKGINPDTRKYLQLLYSSAANLLSFCNYTEETVQDSLRAYQNKKLENYFSTKHLF